VPTREQVRQIAGADLDYDSAARQLGIPAGQAYLIATGHPADGGDTPSDRQRRDGGLLDSSQRLANPPHENPTANERVQHWIASRVAADEQMRAAAAGQTAEPPEPADPNENRDLIVLLTRDHNQIRFLVKQLSALPGHKKGGSAADIARRQSIVEVLTVRLSRHESAEEELLWPTVRSALADGDKWADGGLGQEQEGKETLAELANLDPNSDQFDEHVVQLIAQLRKHVAYEEQVFLQLRSAVAVEEMQQLGKRLLQTEAPAQPGHA
jgi:hemerythrin-like domain-containing protein